MYDRMVRALIALLLLVSPARADVALVLTDVERSALISAIAAGLQAQPQTSSAVVYLLNKINTAPVVTSQKEIPDPKKDGAP